MKTEEWKFGYVSENSVVVYDKRIYTFRVFNGHFLENVKVVIEENGTLNITGNEIYYDFYFERATELEWKNEPEENEIRVRKVGWPWRRREEKYLEGWIKTKKRIPFNMEFGNNWTLERRGDRE